MDDVEGPDVCQRVQTPVHTATGDVAASVYVLRRADES